MAKMSASPLLSIIVPCFNAERYIDSTFQKLLSLKINKEIIAINDGSTDKTLSLLEAYSSQIKIINLPSNKGVSNARNLGIKLSTGKYIAFLDVDDLFEASIYKKMITKLIQEKATIAFCGLDFIELNGKITKSKYLLNYLDSSSKFTLVAFLLNKIFPSVCTSVFLSKIVKQIRFNETIEVGEDILFCLQYLLKSTKSVFINEKLYHYVQHKNSSLHNLSDKLTNYLIIPSLLKDEEQKILNDSLSEEFNYFKLTLVQRAVNAISSTKNSRNRKKCVQLLQSVCDKNICKKIISNKYSPRYIKIEFRILKIFGPGFHLFCFPLYKLIRRIVRK